MTPKEAVDAMFSAFVPLKEEHLLTIDEFAERRKIVLEALDQKAKQAKILDMLKNKVVNLDWVKQIEDCDEYNYKGSFHDLDMLTQEEYDLLKEWLNG